MYSFINDQVDKIIVIEDSESNEKTGSDSDLNLHKSIVKMLGKNKDVKEIRIKRQEAIRLMSKNNNKNLILPEIDVLNTKVLLINKTGDVEIFTSEEFIEAIEKDEIVPLYQDIKLISSKEDFLNMNDHDHMILMYVKDSDNKNFFSYDSSEFRFFRNLLYKLNFFNIKYLVANESKSSFLSSLNLESGIYLVNRKNLFKSLDNNNSDSKSNLSPIIYKENMESFQLFNIPQIMMFNEVNFDEISQSSKKSIQSFLNMVIKQNLNFYCYTNNSVGLLHGVELLPMFFKNIPYYLLFTDLSIDSNRNNFNSLKAIFSKYYSQSINHQFNSLLIVIDNEKFTEKQYLIKTFEDKFFNTELSNKEILEAPLENFKPVISKKIIFNDMNKIDECLLDFDLKTNVNRNAIHCEELLKIIKKENIDYKENHYIDKEVKNKLFQVDHVLLKDLIDQLKTDNNKKDSLRTNNQFKFSGLYNFNKLIVLVKNREEKLNRNSEEFLVKLTLNDNFNQGNHFVTINNSDSNMKFINSLINENNICLKDKSLIKEDNKKNDNLGTVKDENNKNNKISKIGNQLNLPFILILSKDECIIHTHDSIMSYNQEYFNKNLKELIANKTNFI